LEDLVGGEAQEEVRRRHGHGAGEKIAVLVLDLEERFGRESASYMRVALSVRLSRAVDGNGDRVLVS
jgi:hypothetical protein